MKTLIAFDMDGTLINSLGVTIEVLGEAIQSATGIKPTKHDIVKHFGLSEERIFDAMFGADKGLEVNSNYNKLFRNHVHRTTMFPDIREMLSELSQTEDVSLALYTARGRGTTDILLEHHEILEFFECVITGTEVTNGKPHPEGLLKMRQTLGMLHEPMYYIGDSHKDIEMAKAISAIPLGVQWCPLVDKEKLKTSQPTLLFDEPHQLRSYFNDDLLAKINNESL